MHLISAGGGRALNYRFRAAADGAPTLAFSNSLGTDLRVWDRLVEALPAAYGIILYDSRGHGLSSLGEPPYTMDDHVADLSAVLDATGTGPVVLVGLSVGGLIAQAYALAHPERLRAVVLMCTGARIMDVARWTERIALVEKEGLDGILDGNMARWFTAKFRTPDNAYFEGMRTMFRRQSAAGYVATCATLRDTDLRGDVGAIALPVLAIAGEEDGATPPDLVKATADAIPGAVFTEIAAVGHIPCVEAPDRVAAAITGFLGQNGLV